MRNRALALLSTFFVVMTALLSPAAPAQAATVEFRYTGMYDYVSDATYPATGAKGVSVHASNHKPYVYNACGSGAPNYTGRTTYHSLFEVIIQSRDGQQGVETGWTIDCKLNNGSLNPHFFVYRWTNGAPGCYNDSPCGGFVNNPNETMDPGDAVTYTPVGYNPSTVYDYEIVRCDLLPSWSAANNRPSWAPAGTGNGWCIRYQKVGDPDNEVGMYPDSLWTDEGVTFDRVGAVQAFGEVAYDSEDQAEPCADYGSGIFAYNNATPPAPNAGAAWVKAYGLHQPTSGAADWEGTVGGAPPTSAARVYDYGTASTPDPDSFRWGGPGDGGNLGGC